MRVIYHEGFDRSLEPGLSPGAELSGAYYLQRQGWPGIGAFGLGVIFKEGRRAGGAAMGSEIVSFPYRVGILAGAPRITGPRDDLKRVMLGGAWLIDDPSYSCNMFQIGDDDFGVRCYLRWDAATQQVQVRDATGTVVGTTSAWDGTTWKYIEMDVVRHATTGTVKVWFDDVLVFDLTGVNTGDATYGYTSVQFFPGRGRVDDFYVLDPEGADSDDVRLGKNTASIGLNPTSDVSVQFTPDSGANNYSRLSTLDNDGDASYNATSADAQTDLFGYPALSVTTVAAVTVRPFARRPSGGGARVTPLTKVGATTYSGSNADTGDGSYNSFQKVWQLNPGTSAAWDETALNAAKFGYKSSDLTDPLRVTMNVVEVLAVLSPPPPPPVTSYYTTTTDVDARGVLNVVLSFATSTDVYSRSVITQPLSYRTVTLIDDDTGGNVAVPPPADWSYRTETEAFARVVADVPEVSFYKTTTEAGPSFDVVGVSRYTTVTAAGQRVRLVSDGRAGLLVQDLYPR